MTEEVTAHRPREISGFTLFWSDSKYDNGKDPPKVPGWQMNVRRKGENGWDCKQIPDDQAQAILSMLETSGHPDGPWTVKRERLYDSSPVLLNSARMVAALEADGEKLHQITGQDHGPFPIPDDLFAPGLYSEMCLHGRPLDQDCYACDEEDGREGIPVALKPTYDAPEDIADFLALVADWKAAMIANTEARDDVA